MKRKFITNCIAVMIVLSSSLASALPSNTIVIGNKAFAIETLFGETYKNELTSALTQSGGIVYYNLARDTDGFVDLFSGNAMTDEVKNSLKDIKLLKADGSIWNYGTFDTEEPVEVNDEDFNVADIF